MLKPNMATEYLGYLRKSRQDLEAEARGEGDTLARHEAELRRTAERLGITIKTFYREIKSGESIAARPLMQQLLDEVERGLWKGVLVVEVERLARGDTIDQGVVAQAFKFTNTLIVTPSKVYDPNNEFDEEYFEFGLFMSRREYKVINRRLQRGRVASVKEGKYVGNIPPYGYERIKLVGQKGFSLKIVPGEADAVRMIYEFYANGLTNPDGTHTRLGAGRIASQLNELRIPSRSGDFWSPSAVSCILKNPVYCGKLRWGSRAHVKTIVSGQVVQSRPRAKDYILVDGLHDPIVSKELWDSAQESFPSNPPVQYNTRLAMKNPLSGLVLCGLCGHTMLRRPYISGYPDTLLCSNKQCGNVGSSLELVKNRLKEALQEWLEQYEPSLPEQMQQGTPSVEVYKKGLAKIEKECAILKKQQSATHDLLEQGVYSVDMFTARIQELSTRQTELEAERSELQEKYNEMCSLIESRAKLVPRVHHLLDIYERTEDVAHLNQLLRQVIDRVIYTKTADGRFSENAQDDFSLELFMKLPK